MQGRQAKTLNDNVLNRVLDHLRHGRSPHRDIVIVLFSAKAGLRAGEIAGLDWEMLVDSGGQVTPTIHVEGRIAKGGSGRRIPMHPALQSALEALHPGNDAHGPVIRSQRGGRLRPNSVVNWFANLYRELGLRGCSSHSGRRTFITNAARKVHAVGGSLRDVQLLAGHRSIAVTQRYIDGDTDAQHRLVSLI